MNVPPTRPESGSSPFFEIPALRRLLLIGVFIFAALADTPVEGRTWTDVQGRKIEAEIVRASDTEVVVMLRGKEVAIPLSKLSEEDQDYVAEWLEENAGEEENDEDGGAARWDFDGRTLKTGGEMNLFEYEYDEQDREIVSKIAPDSKDKGWKLAIAVPEDFDPAKPQRVFIASAAVNNDQQRLAGNVGVFGMYAPACVASGWVCIAYDTDIGRAGHNHDLISAFSKLSKEWPELRNWDFAVGGFSGGAKGCFYPLAYLIKNEYRAVGAFLGGCNDGTNCDRAKDFYKARSKGYRDVKTFISTGDKDNLVAKDHVDLVIDAVKEGGIREIRSEFFEGGHQFHRPHFEEALKWFGEAE